ncbi:MAG TPA: hypothetical protein VEU47_13260 [Candidatus Cybelea sp.]|nr:hypothetical protein [Candidatus Cybelea sp.]
MTMLHRVSLLSFLVANTWRRQLVILAVSLATLPLYYATLEIPKRIVNEALGAEPIHFPSANMLFGSFGGNPSRFTSDISLFGEPLGRMDHVSLLLVLCTVLILLHLSYGALKLFVNNYKAVLGEQMLLEIRSMLFNAVDKHANGHLAGGSAAAIVTSEVEPLIGYFGDALATPVMEGGLLISALIFMFNQSIPIGLAAVLIYIAQLSFVPRLQQRQTRLEALRVVQARRVGALAARAAEIGRDTGAAEHQRIGMHFAANIHRVFRTRKRYYAVKFGLNFLMNFCGQLVPFLLYAVGGILVLRGQLSLGSLVAIVAAHGNMLAPWKELLDYTQDYRSARTKYRQIFEGVGLATFGGGIKGKLGQAA